MISISAIGLGAVFMAGVLYGVMAAVIFAAIAVGGAADGDDR